MRGSFRGITVLERGASPRIVRAEVNGTNGVTQVTGPQLRTAFGLYDSWATFTYISSKSKVVSSDGDGDGGDDASAKKKDKGDGSTTSAPATAPSSGAAANGGASGDASGDGTTGGASAAAVRGTRAPVRRVLSGTFTVARGTTLSVQRRGARGWVTVGLARVGAGGAYRASLPGAGSYRVARGDVAGPAVRVR